MESKSPSVSREWLARLRQFVDRELVPLEPLFLSADWAQLEPVLAQKRRAAKEQGFWAPHLPKEISGLGLSLVDLGLVSEIAGRTPTGHYVLGCQAPDAGNAELLLQHGTAEQKARWLEPLARGDIRSCFAMTEPENPGSNPTTLTATAVRSGDEYVINGHKWFTSSADGARFAIVMAVTSPSAPRHQRASMFIVELDRPGFQLVRNIPVMGHAGGGYYSHAEVRFTDCRVPASHLLGPENMGFVLAQDRLGPGRIHHCMRWLGISQRALDELIYRALTREIAEGQRLADQQIVQTWIAESAAEIRAARALVLQAAEHAEREGFKAARDDIGMIKYLTAQAMERVLDRAIQAHGALGVTDDTILAFLYRHERAARIYDGPDEVHKLAVARSLLKQHAARMEGGHSSRGGSTGPRDEAAPPRAGEELDAAKLQEWLARQNPELTGPLHITQFPGGFSNLTYLVRQGEREWVLRRPPFGTKAKTAHDMGREFRVLSALRRVFPYSPKPVLSCEDESVMGSPFYVMERIQGTIIRRDLPAGLTLSPGDARTLCENLLDVQVALHRVDVQAAGLADFGKPEGYVRRQVEGWSERYRKARTQDVPDAESLMKWLEQHQPAESGRAALIHNDYKFDNVVLDPKNPLRIIGVLDWEMATLGDPLMDLGCSVAYWTQADDPPDLQMIRQLPTHLPGMMTRRELVARYAEKSGIAIGDFHFYYVFGLFRLAVIAQQIYYRYANGQTTNKRFAQFGQIVAVLCRHAERVIQSGKF
jgi:aminoglycoside phosphotransferase (APT) family kinase protein/alkylation response protein AidB-like acyl-CoA dehydrogenase